MSAGGKTTPELVSALLAECEHRRDTAQASANDHEGSGNEWQWQADADFYGSVIAVISSRRADTQAPNVTDAMDVLERRARHALGAYSDSSDATSHAACTLADLALVLISSLRSAAVAPAPREAREDEHRETDRMRRAVIATCKGCLAAACGEPLHTVAKSGYEPRTLEGDSWENGWQFIADSAQFQSHTARGGA